LVPFYYHIVIRRSFGIFFLVLVYYAKKNLATLVCAVTGLSRDYSDADFGTLKETLFAKRDSKMF
jgi:hypothetical protein